MLSTFDYGRSLQKQIEGFKRLPAVRQQSRLPGYQRQLETYANNYLYNVLTHPTVKPGLLRSGAETLVEASRVLANSASAYRVFAELAARSRKVEAVPGLSNVVDKLLELPTDQKKERAALLSWRIVAGNLPTSRLVKYLADRAHMTNSSGDWRDYASGVASMVRKGEIPVTDEGLVDILNDLIANKESLGDMVTVAQRDLAEAMLQRRSYRQAETLLMTAAAEGKELSQSFIDTVEKLLAAKPDSLWELHQVVILPTLTRYGKGETEWRQLKPLLERAAVHLEELARLLLERPEMPANPPLAAFAAGLIAQLPPEQVPTMPEKVRQLLDRVKPDIIPERRPEAQAAETLPIFEPAAPPAQPAKQALPELTLAAVPEDRPAPAAPESDADADDVPVESAAAPKPEATPQPRQRPAVRLSSRDVVELERSLAAALPEESTLDDLRHLAGQLEDQRLEPWADLHARMWCALRVAPAAPAEALELLDNVTAAELRHPQPEAGQELVRSLGVALEAQGVGSTSLLLARAALALGNALLALQLAEGLGNLDADRQEILRIIDAGSAQRGEERAENLIAFAEAQRMLQGDPQAGLVHATRAALLATGNEEVQNRYLTWVDSLPGEEVQHARAAQGVYLSTRERQAALLPVALEEIDALLTETGRSTTETAGWLQQLAPLLAEVPASQQPDMLYRYARLMMRDADGGPEATLPEPYYLALSGLDAGAAEGVFNQLSDLLSDADKLKIECLLHLRRGDWKTAATLVGAAYDELEDEIVPVQMIGSIFRQLPDGELLDASRRLLEVLQDRDDPDAAMEVVRRIELKLEGSPGLPHRTELKHLMQTALAHMAENEYEPASRFIRERSPRRTQAAEGKEAAAGHANGLVGELLDYLLEQLGRVDNSGRRR